MVSSTQVARTAWLRARVAGPSWALLATVLIVGAALLYAAGAAWVWPHARFGFWASTSLEFVLPLTGGAFAIRRGWQLSGRARQSWVLLGSGACSYSAGMVSYSWYEVVRHTSAPFPGPPDVGYLLAVVLLAAGMARYPTLARRRWSLMRSGLDSALVMTSTLLLGWVLVLGDVYAADGVGWFTRGVAMAYPSGDVLVISMLLMLVRRTTAGGRMPLLILLTGMLMLVCADTAYVLLSANGTYYTGHWVDPGWWAGLSLVGAAAYSYSDGSDTPVAEEQLHRRTILVPYVAALTALAAIAVHWLSGNIPNPFEVSLVVAVIALLLARQAVVAMDTVDLAAQLHHRANHDALTDLPNRRSLHDHLESTLTNGRSLEAVLFIDLDGFKEVNDTLGHEAGDVLLCEAARRLQLAVRGEDVVARLGGDEFAVVIAAGSDPDAAAQRLLTPMREPFEVAGTTVALTASIGVAPMVSGCSGDQLLRNADLAMYQAKSAGRDQVIIYQAGLHDLARDRLHLHNALREAGARKEFTLLYQPLVDLTTERICGVEALLRWEKDGQLLPPAEFLPMLEATGLIVPLGDWILDQACADLADWHDAGHHDLYVAVNIAARQITSPDFTERVAATLARRRIPAQKLTLEITENAVLDGDPTVSGVFDRLAALGITLSLDDFGTGYASLSTLRTVPVSEIKIDTTFIAELDHGGSPLVDGIAYLAHRFGISVVAEGVETPRQRERLRDTGIRYGQGFLFAPPSRAVDITRRLQHDGALSDVG